MVMLNPWQEDLVRKSGGLISRAQAATMSPQGTIPTGYNPSAGQNISGLTPEQLIQQFGFGTAPTNARTPEEILRQSGFGATAGTNLTEYERILQGIQTDAARNPDQYRSMPDSEARAELERQSSDTLQAQLAARQAEAARMQAARQAELQAEIASLQREYPQDSTQVAADPQTIYDMDKINAEREAVTIEKDVPKEIARINEWMTLFKMEPVTSLDEFLDLVRRDDPSIAGTTGDLRGIYEYLYPTDPWRITTPLQGGPPVDGPPLGGPPLGGDGTTLYVDPNDPQVMGAGPGVIPDFAEILKQIGMYMSNANLGGIGGYGMPPIIAYQGYGPSTGRAMQAGEYPMLPVPPVTGTDDRTPTAPDGDKEPKTPEEEFDLISKVHGLQREIDPLTLNAFNREAKNVIETGTLSPYMGLVDDINWPLSDQYEDIQQLMTNIIYQRQQGIVSEASELDMIMQVIDRARAEKELEFQVDNAERNYNLAKSKLQLDAISAIDEGRQFDESLAFEERRAASELNQANAELQVQQQQFQQQMGLERYQTDIANPFNVAAFNLLNAPADSRAYQSAQQQDVTQSHLNDALKTAQFHAGRSGGVDDPEVRKKAAQIAQGISDPRQKAAMLAIAQGVSDITQIPQQQMGGATGRAMGAPTGGMGGNLVQMPQVFDLPTESQTVPQYAQQMEGQGPLFGQLPGPLSALGMNIPQTARFGQPMNIQEFFPRGMPTVASITNLPETSQRTLGAVGESTAQSASDIMQAARNITPQVAGQSSAIQPTLKRLLPQGFGGR